MHRSISQSPISLQSAAIEKVYQFWCTEKMNKLNKNNFSDWKQYYHAYQMSLAEDYYIPYLLRNNIKIEGRDILEIGCGNGGFIEGFAKHSDRCVGFDLKKLDWESNTVDLRNLDAFDADLPNKLGRKFNLIILRDVVEHLENKRIHELFKQIDSLLKEDGQVLVTFPPFYSPFGLHQQVLLNNFLRYVPFLSVFPKFLIRFITNSKVHKMDNVEELLSLYESKKTISSFYKIADRNNYKITHEKFFFVRPSHEIRYGFKTKESRFLSRIPVLRELFTTGTVFIINKN